MRNKKQNSDTGINRMHMTVAFLFLLAVGIACLFQIFRLSLTEYKLSTGKSDECINTTVDGWVDKEGCKCYVKENPLQPNRGEIYDDNGRLLIGNYTVFEVAFDGNKFYKEFSNRLKYTKNEPEQILKNLSHDFYLLFKDRYPKRDEKFYYDFFKKHYAEKTYGTLIPVNVWNERTWVSSIDTAKIRHFSYLKKKVMNVKTNEITGEKQYFGFINFVSIPVRINPYGEMARRTLGIKMVDRQFGMEQMFDSYLAGEKGSKEYLELNKARVPLKKRIDPVDGYNVHTTLNLEIQNVVHNEMSRKLQELNAEWGCAIVMETKTGEIKAITNLRRESEENPVYSETMEYAMNAKVEPGSTFKLASLLAFFEKGMKDTDTIYPMFAHTFKYPLKSGGFRTYNKVDSKVHGERLGAPNEIFQRSSNIGVASMIFNAYGIKHFADYHKQLEKFGLFDTIHTQMGDLMPASIRDDGKFDNYYAVCFGAGFHLPVMRTLMYYNAIANNGKMMKPLFIKCITNDVDTIEKFEPEVVMQKMVSDHTLNKARAYLDSVVWGRYGTGRHYKDPACPFAGKTGTRDLWDEKTKQWVYDRNAVSFCGYFPKDDPKYTVIVYIYNVIPHSEVAVDVFAKIARSIMNCNNYSAMRSIYEYPKLPFKQTSPVNKRYFNTLVAGLGYDTLAISTPQDFLTLQCVDSVKLEYKALNIGKLENAPNVVNMIASDAVTQLNRKGYKAIVIGRGIVKKQVVDQQSKVVRLYLEPPSRPKN